jgi:hypothetical protein
MGKETTSMLAPLATIYDDSVASLGYAGCKSIPAAIQLYDRAFADGRRGQLWSALSRRPNRLGSLVEATAETAMLDRHDAGVHTVAIERIRGSEGRHGDFDADFRPLQKRTRDRWLSLASARLQGVSIPPIELIQIDETYFVRDGHHRLSVARAIGEEYVEAHVTVWAKKRQVSEQKWPMPRASLSWTISAAHARA